MRYSSQASLFIATITLLTTAMPSPAQDLDSVVVRTMPLTENLYIVRGAGGSMLLLDGDGGSLLVDADCPDAGLTKKICAAIEAVGAKPVRILIDTHWHFDHVGGNEAFAKAGTLIVAQENVRKRMSAKQHIAHIEETIEASPAAALPVITYRDAMTIYWKGEEVRITHIPNAHTDGDSFVYFVKADVLHVGDTCFAGMYPFIDVNVGGSIDGMIRAAGRVLELAGEKTKIITGHGPMLAKEDMRAYRQMLITTRERVQALIDAGKTREEAVAAKPTKDLDDQYGHGGFPPDQWVAIVYDSLKGRP